MASNNELPAILVSAIDVATASEIITELISDGVEPPHSNGVGAESPGADEEPSEPPSPGVPWLFENKYYSARVRLLPSADRPTRDAPPADLQAHLIYLTPEECSDESACSRRAAAASARLARGAVRLVGARCASPPRALRAWARAERYELVPLQAPPPEPEPELEPETAGAARLREALHAHVWPGLVLRGALSRPPPNLADADSSADSSDSSWGSWRRAGEEGGEGQMEGEQGEEDEAGAVERAEQFAAALALLPGARGSGGAAGEGGEGDAARRLQAERLVAAFCRAFGHPLPPDERPPQ